MISQDLEFDQELTKEIKDIFVSKEANNTFKNEIQSNILLLVRGIYRIKANSNDVAIGVNEVSKSYWISSMENRFSIDFEPVFQILANNHLLFYSSFYLIFLSFLENQISPNPKFNDTILKPPEKLHWPNRGLINYDNEFMKIYEAKCFKLFNTGKWTPKRVALANIDLIPACKMIFEMSVCYLNSALWLLKEFIDNKSNGKSKVCT